jgi:putative spermidine/putrescine transport system permease protein
VTDQTMMAADGTPLRVSLNRALRRQKLRALALIAPLLLFILITFIAPIADMLFRSVENQMVGDTIPRTAIAIRDWDATSGEPPPESVYAAMAADLMIAAEEKTHTQLGTRLNYENSGLSSLLRGAGRDVEDWGEEVTDALTDLDGAWDEPETWIALLAAPDWIAAQAAWAETEDGPEPAFAAAAVPLPRTVAAYQDFARITQVTNEDSPTEEEPWHQVSIALVADLREGADISGFTGDNATRLAALRAAVTAGQFPPVSFRDAMVASDEAWGDPAIWGTIQTYIARYTPGYYLNAIDLGLDPTGVVERPDDEQVYLMLFARTAFLSLTITLLCILLGYPVAWICANLPARTANLLMILVLLPFWTSLLVRTSAWKVLLQQQGVINDILVWIGLVADNDRLIMINNQTGTIIAMTHILLPFMILPLYSVMKTIPPSYLRAAKSLGANDWTAFWRVYFPQSVPGIGAGSILVFILAIGYYITPELVGGAKGVFISNRIAYHISTSLNWGLAAALGTILLAAVLLLYWVYDRVIGIDNVKLGG